MTVRIVFIWLFFAFAATSATWGQSLVADDSDGVTARFAQFAEAHCFECHDRVARKGELAIDELLDSTLSEHVESWEHIVRKLVSRRMPPPGAERPSEDEYNDAVGQLVGLLDRNTAARPNPGRTESLRRLTQSEYQNAIRDLLDLQVDVSQLLPSDESSHGFDNVTVTDLSPVLLDRYVSAAQKISRLAVGDRAEAGAETTFRVRPDITQDVHLEGAPLGTRGGAVVQYNFPQDGEYEIQAWLMRDRNDEIESLRGSQTLEILLDHQRVGRFTIARPRNSSDRSVDANLITRVDVTAGPHEVAVVFPKTTSSLLETTREPLHVHYNFYRHPRLGPAVFQFTIRGPFHGRSGGDTPSRRRIFVRYPKDKDDEIESAEAILSNLMRRAFRRNVTDADLASPMAFFREANEQRGFDAGIEMALGAILVNPQFLFRIERDPEGISAGESYKISPEELATRLSFFLWSSIPDDELLELAVNGQLQQPDVLEAQVRRMLADERSDSLVKNFAGQWLYLRNLESVVPDMRLYPDFDDNLRQAMRRETELFFASIIREDRNVLDLLRADYTFLNERLAKHYGIDHVYGSRFRRVALDEASHRGGLLRQASILTVTSYATRTSPVKRGNWVLENLLGDPPPPPPPNVPALKDNTVLSTLSVRERLEQHRSDEACASCHKIMDPIGFSLENFDAIGRWRDRENESPIDASGVLVDGATLEGPSDLENALLERPELFVRTLTEKLMTFALGRGVEYYDAPAIRRVVRESGKRDYRFSDIVLEIVKSVPFQMRRSQ